VAVAATDYNLIDSFSPCIPLLFISRRPSRQLVAALALVRPFYSSFRKQQKRKYRVTVESALVSLGYEHPRSLGSE
jgi:hypothetical protein